MPLRLTLESGAEQGHAPSIEALKEPPRPPHTEYLLRCFWDLRAACANGFGPGAIGFGDIKAYSELTGIDLTPIEVDALRKMDIALLTVLTAKDDPGETNEPAPE